MRPAAKQLALDVGRPEDALWKFGIHPVLHHLQKAVEQGYPWRRMAESEHQDSGTRPVAVMQAEAFHRAYG